MAERDLSDYVEVAERIVTFYDKYPEGSLQAAEPWRVVQVDAQWCRQCIGRRQIKPKAGDWKQCPRCGGTGIRDHGEPVLDTFICYVAAAYRTPDDPRPGIGVAWEPYPGQTPYTLGSELQNAETSAWGRALAALGIETKRGIASRDEVRNRRAERDDGLPVNRDGSTSRSRVTDAQLEATGQMTRTQAAEHGQLAKPPSNARSVDRSVEAAVDDPWMDGPAGLSPEVDPEDRPGTCTPQQIGGIKALYAQLGVKDRDKQIETTRTALGLDMLSSHTRLSYRQAGDLIVALRKQERVAGKL